MLIKTLLIRMENFKGFVFGRIRVQEPHPGRPILTVEIRPRKGSRPECPVCGRKRAVYDTSRSARGSSIFPCGTTGWSSASSLAGSTVPRMESRANGFPGWTGKSK